MSVASERERVSSWGGLSVRGREVVSERLDEIVPGLPITRGLGRSYGDSALPAPGDDRVAGSRRADRILAWDPRDGTIRVEAGVSAATLVRIFLPRRWFLPVTPGTQYVTVGGMIASDVHGKNHHVAGTFGAHVSELVIWTADGRRVRCSPSENRDLFLATIGGMGLTGHILEAEFRLDPIPSPWILGESERVSDVEKFVRKLKACASEWPFTMGWIDALGGGRRRGRGLLIRGRWATPEEAPRTVPRFRRPVRVPVTFPNWLLNRPLMRLFNELYYRSQLARVRRRIYHPGAFFYPLDGLQDWYRLYGSRGFTQYQCVLPDGESVGRAARELLQILKRARASSFLCVIKDCGAEGEGLLSFPRPGISIAVDLPIGRHTKELVAVLNRFVARSGGRIYLTKDRFTTAESFREMEPGLDEFERARRKWDPEGRFRSAQSERIFGDRS